MNVMAAATAEIEHTNCLRQIIAKQMVLKSIAIRDLEREGVIRSRGTFWKRIENGTIRFNELIAVLQYLQIDLVRALFAMRTDQGGKSYFCPVTDTHSILSCELYSALHELVGATGGDFQPVKRAMCQSVAKKVANDIVEYDSIRRRFNEGEIDFSGLAKLRA